MSIKNVVSHAAVWFGLCAAGVGSAAWGGQPDIFAEIGARQTDYQDRKLVPITPPKLEHHLLPMNAAGTAAAFQPAPKMTTAEQVRQELERQLEIHAPYLKDLAPPLEGERVRVSLDSFDWRVETAGDRSDFLGTLAGQGKWQRVKIPHYGPPMGRAVTYYRTEFDVTQAMLDKGALFACFKGVDYKTHVFVNGALVGSHEGLFAPFEFEFTPHARLGKNVLLAKVVNDYIMMGNCAEKGFLAGAERLPGNKVYAAVGPGWDDPRVGWHSCPPGMGIYQDVSIEARRRVHIHDVFVRPLSEEGKVEAWIEVFNCDCKPVKVVIDLSVLGQNFSASAFHGTIQTLPGLKTLNVGEGVSCFKIPLTVSQPRRWEPDSPWLYQLQVKLFGDRGRLLDTAKQQFGLRTFRMEYDKEPKGRMYLNGRGIKLRGANTMGAFQQCVMHKNWQQLIDDILLAKVTHMNYIRLTQCPVQAEIYDYCDRLGLLLQTDLPLFACVGATSSARLYVKPKRWNGWCDLIRQTSW